MLRDFQQKGDADIFQAWDEGAINVMGVFPTGSGKTVLAGYVIKKLDVPTCAIAHRQELVGQIALALNREDIPHGIIAPKEIVKQIVALEMDTHGHSRYNSRAPVRVAGVDTLIKRDASDRWFNQVGLGFIDEGHHVLRNNKWGRAMGMLPNAKGLFMTAHALRADGAGLGRDSKTADGLVDRLVIGPCGRDLINRGFLTNYRLICPPSHINLSEVNIGSTGDFNPKQLRVAVHNDKAIVGDVVSTYCRVAKGKLWVTFAVDIEAATELAKGYRAAGVPAEVITADTPTAVRAQLMRKFRNRQILQLVSVDVLGEGVDVPAIEGVSMARPTASFQLYAQQFGRALRLLIAPDILVTWDQLTDEQRLYQISISDKPYATIIDHVGNVHRFYEEHKYVDFPQVYSLNRRERTTKERKGDAIPLRTCLFCLLPYEAVEPVCPNCGQAHIPQGRTKPDQVDGDLLELDPMAIQAMYEEIRKLDSAPVISYNKNDVVANSIAKSNRERMHAQATLREAIALWAGWQRHQGRSDAEGYRRFFYRFGMDVLSAQALKLRDAQALEAKIRLDLSSNNIISAQPEFALA